MWIEKKLNVALVYFERSSEMYMSEYVLLGTENWTYVLGTEHKWTNIPQQSHSVLQCISVST